MVNIDQKNHKTNESVINSIKNLAQLRGGQCLSNVYINANSKLLFQCDKKHMWETTYAIIKNHWCPTCADNSLKLSIEDMQQLAKSKNGKCLSKEYINARTKLEWQCENLHIWQATPGNVKQGHWCPKCGQKRKKIN